jgi:hypothetical protein
MIALDSRSKSAAMPKMAIKAAGPLRMGLVLYMSKAQQITISTATSTNEKQHEHMMYIVHLSF